VRTDLRQRANVEHPCTCGVRAGDQASPIGIDHDDEGARRRHVHREALAERHRRVEVGDVVERSDPNSRRLAADGTPEIGDRADADLGDAEREAEAEGPAQERAAADALDRILAQGTKPRSAERGFLECVARPTIDVQGRPRFLYR
jgi:hypothetical protein